MTGKLTVVTIKALLAKGLPARHADGGNLYLAVTGKGAAKWTFRYMVNGKAREMGLGACDPEGRNGRAVAQARSQAEAARKVLREGSDPLDQRAAQARAKAEAAARAQTFKDVALIHISAHGEGWRNAKHKAQWGSTLEAYAFPTLGSMSVADIGTEDVLRVLRQPYTVGGNKVPLWNARPETATRLRGRIEAVLAYAAARGWRAGDNPARWKGHLSAMLPARAKVAKVKHHAALPWQELGAFMVRLRGLNATAARALEYTVLTGCRTGEVLGARWSEVDIDAAVWTVPAERMKAGREHRIPLSTGALAVLRGLLPLRPKDADGYVFPGQKRGKPLSSMAMLMLLRRMDRSDLTAHGFRSTFRDWTEEATSTPHAVAEAALAHTIGDKVEAAYRRGDLFQKRAALMEEWSDYCAKAPADLVSLCGSRGRVDCINAAGRSVE